MQVDETDRTGSSSESALLASRQAMVTRSSSLQRLDKAKPVSTRWEEVLDELTSLVDGYEAMSLQIPSAALFALNKLAQRASQLNGDTSSVDFLITSRHAQRFFRQLLVSASRLFSVVVLLFLWYRFEY
eukprot:4383654-Pleurochrysis_carterae.AAC.2